MLTVSSVVLIVLCLCAAWDAKAVPRRAVNELAQCTPSLCYQCIGASMRECTSECRGWVAAGTVALAVVWCAHKG